MTANLHDARGLPPGYPFREGWEVSPLAARDELSAAEPPILLDVRRADEWEIVRLPGAVHIPLSELERRADELEDDDGRRDRPVIVYCHHGARSLRAAAALRAMGFADVRSMTDGIDLWATTVEPGMRRY